MSPLAMSQYANFHLIERTAYRYSRLAEAISQAAPHEQPGYDAFIVYLERAKPSIAVAQQALSAYKYTLALEGSQLGESEVLLRRAIQGLAAGPPQQERHAITDEEAARVFTTAATKRQGQMYQFGFMVAFAAGLRHQQLARLTAEQLERSPTGAPSIVIREGLKGPRPPSGVRSPEVHEIPAWGKDFCERLINGRKGRLFPTCRSPTRRNGTVSRAADRSPAPAPRRRS